MKISIISGLCISILLAIIMPASLSEVMAETELEVNDIRPLFGGVETDVKNVGNEIAEDISITIYVTGGIFNKINIQHDCAGCNQCGTTLASGGIKTENSLEAGFIIGFGNAEITVTASASNADEVSKTVTGLVVGPFMILNS